MNAEPRPIALIDRERAAHEAATAQVRNEDPLDQPVVTIGSKPYYVRALSAKRSLILLDLLSEKVETIVALGLLDADALATYAKMGGGDTTAFAAIAPRVLSAVRVLPDLFERGIGIMLGVSDAAEAAAVFEELELTAVPSVIDAWMRVNPWRDIIDAFFRLGRTIVQEARTARASNEPSS